MQAVRPTNGSPEHLRTPVRTCLGCRRRDEQHALLRVVAERSSAQPPGGWALVPDERRRGAGRGAYVHPTPECVQTAVQRQAFGRALRQSGRPEVSALQAWLARRSDQPVGSPGPTVTRRGDQVPTSRNRKRVRR